MYYVSTNNIYSHVTFRNKINNFLESVLRFQNQIQPFKFSDSDK